MDKITITFGDVVREATRDNAFDFFNTLFPRGVILVDLHNGMVGISVPPRGGSGDEKEPESK